MLFEKASLGRKLLIILKVYELCSTIDRVVRQNFKTVDPVHTLQLFIDTLLCDEAFFSCFIEALIIFNSQFKLIPELFDSNQSRITISHIIEMILNNLKEGPLFEMILNKIMTLYLFFHIISVYIYILVFSKIQSL